MKNNFDEQALKQRVADFYSRTFESDSPFYDSWSEGDMDIRGVKILVADEENKYLYLELLCSDGSCRSVLWSVETNATQLMWRSTGRIGISGHSFSNGHLIKNDWTGLCVYKILEIGNNTLSTKKMELINPKINTIRDKELEMKFQLRIKNEESYALQIEST